MISIALVDSLIAQLEQKSAAIRAEYETLRVTGELFDAKEVADWMDDLIQQFHEGLVGAIPEAPNNDKLELVGQYTISGYDCFAQVKRDDRGVVIGRMVEIRQPSGELVGTVGVREWATDWAQSALNQLNLTQSIPIQQ